AVRTGGAGTVTVGASDRPAIVEIVSWSPLALGQVDVPVAGRGLHVGDARTSLEIGRLDLALRVSGAPAQALVVAGDVGVANARLESGRGAPSKPGPPRPWYESLPPHL